MWIRSVAIGSYEVEAVMAEFERSSYYSLNLSSNDIQVVYRKAA